MFPRIVRASFLVANLYVVRRVKLHCKLNSERTVVKAAVAYQGGIHEDVVIRSSFKNFNKLGICLVLCIDVTQIRYNKLLLKKVVLDINFVEMKLTFSWKAYETRPRFNYLDVCSQTSSFNMVAIFTVTSKGLKVSQGISLSLFSFTDELFFSG